MRAEIKRAASGDGDEATAERGRVGEDGAGAGASLPVVASLSYLDAVESTGWAHLTVATNGSFADAAQLFAAGFGEGAATHARMTQSYVNANETLFRSQPAGSYAQVLAWLQAQQRWTEDRVRAHAHSDPFWRAIGLADQQVNERFTALRRLWGLFGAVRCGAVPLLCSKLPAHTPLRCLFARGSLRACVRACVQVQGLRAGYASRASPGAAGAWDPWFWNARADLEDVLGAVNPATQARACVAARGRVSQ